MASVFGKLNLKDQKQILVLNSPSSFESELKTLRGVTVQRDLKTAGEIEFSLAFVTKQVEVDTLGKAIGKKTKGDAVVWFAYPKGSSKEIQIRDQPGFGLEDSRRRWVRTCPNGRDRRRLVGSALSPRGLHQDADPRQGTPYVRAGQSALEQVTSRTDPYPFPR